MSKEFIWNLDMDGEIRNVKVVVHEDEIVTYEGETEKKHIKITNKVCKQGVLQIDTMTTLYGQECAIQLEKNIPYIKPGKQWLMSETTYEDRKQKLLHTNKMAAYIEMGFCIVLCLVALGKWLLTGSMGDWWFLIVIGTFIGGSGVLQYYTVKNQLADLEKAENA